MTSQDTGESERRNLESSVSIIIPTYNESENIRKGLTGVLQQSATFRQKSS